MVKKILISFLLALFLLNSIGTNYAQAQWYNQPYRDWYLKVYDDSNEDEIFGERYTAAQVEWVIYGVWSFMLKTVTFGNVDLIRCLFDINVSVCVSAIDYYIDRLNPFTLNPESTPWYLAFTERPVSSVAYFRDVGERLNIVPEAKAQGFGFDAASPVLELWKIARNITYLLMIIAIIVLAFMIMFRVKIAPQTIITVQSALPKIIIALGLITFSYAIAGLLIDLMYVVIGLMASLFTSGPNSLSGLSWSEMFGKLTTESNAFLLTFFYMITFLIAFIPAAGSGGVIATLLGVVTWGFLWPLILLIAIIVMLVMSFRILWLLLKTYAMILIQIIVGPFMILMGVVSQGMGFGTWLRNLVAHLAVYPVVGFMFVIAFVFLRGAMVFPGWLPDPIRNTLDNLITNSFPFEINPILTGGSWDPPLTVFAGATGLLYLGASFVIISLIPNTANIIKAMIERKPFSYGSAIGQAISPTALLGDYGQYKLGKEAEVRKERELTTGKPQRTAGLQSASQAFGNFSRWVRSKK